MAFFYTKSRTSNTDSNFDPARCDAVKCYLQHYENLLVLDFFMRNGTIKERAQATEEMAICKRKMKYWARQPHFNRDRAEREKARLNKTNRHG